jgi:hypothetical protein
VVAAFSEPTRLASNHDEGLAPADNGSDGMGRGLEGHKFFASIWWGLGVVCSKAVSHYIRKDVGHAIVVEAVRGAKVGF